MQAEKERRTEDKSKNTTVTRKTAVKPLPIRAAQNSIPAKVLKLQHGSMATTTVVVVVVELVVVVVVAVGEA